MKKFTLLAAVLFFAILSNAQITKGSTMIGGSLGFSSQDSKQQDQSQTSKQKQSGGSISLQAGTAFATNKMVGVFLSYGHSKTKFENPYSNSEIEGHGYG